MRFGVLLAGCLALSGCGSVGDVVGSVVPAVAPEPVEVGLPRMRWDHREGADDWTEAGLRAVMTHGAVLLSEVPADIDLWCPGYRNASMEDRAAFWVGVFSALSRHESTYNEEAIGGGNRWFGLVQISPATARGYECRATSGRELLEGTDNISCAIRIAAVTVPRDGYVATGREGLAADWGPLLDAGKRADMIGWVSGQAYCAG